MSKNQNYKMAIIGIGYVGLPLAIEFSKFGNIIAYDHDKSRVSELKNGIDRTKEIFNFKIKKIKNLVFTNNQKLLENCKVFFITVPTPVNRKKNPDLKSLLDATRLVAKFLKKNTIVVYESTVYPGCTEDVCGPILEKSSGLKLNKDFFLGYSPERINPGKSKQKLTNTIKIVSGSSKKTVFFLSKLYKQIIKKGIYIADNIKTAEAAKIIENTQRDLNIALVNELSIIFKKLKLDTKKVLRAAETKWNFAPYTPGLVGGHCIGIDPYYLTFKAKKMKYTPKVILAGRKINDNMGNYIGKEVLKLLKKNKKKIANTKILIMGVSYKENCADSRNSKVFDMIKFFKLNKFLVHVYDPLVYRKDFLHKNKITFLDKLNKKNFYDVIMITVPHNKFISIGINRIKKLGKKGVIIFDIKSAFPKNKTDWRL